MKFRDLVLRTTLIALLSVGLTACATRPSDPATAAEFDRTNDPIEPLNRGIFEVNDFLDRILFRPIAQVYRFVIPEFIRDRVAGIVSNMEEPVIFANTVLQGRVTDAGTTVGRFLVNTIGGVGGMFDLADEFGLNRQDGDFGQTLHSWGAGEGSYLVLPFFGPSNIRDAVGKGVDMVMSPWGYISQIGSNATENRFTIASTVGGGVVKREKNIEALDSLKSGSLDFYAQMRSVYRQYRNNQLGITSQAMPLKYDDYEPLGTPMGE
jgi:phospholipid-binding lipoprotein MlaA